MNYSTEDAIEMHHTLAKDVSKWGPDTVYSGLKNVDPELLALMVLLNVLKTQPYTTAT